MDVFLKPLEELADFGRIRKNLQEGICPVQISGCGDTQRCHMAYGLGQTYKYKVLLAANERRAREILEDYKLYERDVLYYPAKDVIFYSADVSGHAIVKERLQVLRRLLSGEPATIVTTIDAGLEHVIPLADLGMAPFTISLGDTISLDILKKQLVRLGYEYEGQVEGRGQFSVRGGIIDIFSLTEEVPYRIELWGEDVDTIRSFDVESQRSIENVSSCTIYPATELLMEEERLVVGLHKITKEQKAISKKMQDTGFVEEGSRLRKVVEDLKSNIDIYGVNANLDSFIHYFYEKTGSFFSYFPQDDTLFIMEEPARCNEKLEAVEIEFRESCKMRLEKGYMLPGQAKLLHTKEEIMAMLGMRKLVMFTTLDNAAKEPVPKRSCVIHSRSINAYNKHFDMLVEDMKRWRKNGSRVLFLAGSRTRAKRLCDDLQYNEIPAFYGESYDRGLNAGEIMVASGKLRKGFVYTDINFVIVTESDIFGEEKKRAKAKRHRRQGS